MSRPILTREARAQRMDTRVATALTRPRPESDRQIWPDADLFFATARRFFRPNENHNPATSETGFPGNRVRFLPRADRRLGEVARHPPYKAHRRPSKVVQKQNLFPARSSTPFRPEQTLFSARLGTSLRPNGNHFSADCGTFLRETDLIFEQCGRGRVHNLATRVSRILPRKLCPQILPSDLHSIPRTP